MKKGNLITLAVLCAAMLLAVVLTVNGRAGIRNDEPGSVSEESSASDNASNEKGQSETGSAEIGESSSAEPSSSQAAEGSASEKAGLSSASSQQSEQSKHSTSAKPTDSDMSGALFIGDSRTVGLMEYAEIKNADFFCNTGMSCFNIDKARVSVPSVGKVSLNELLSAKKYDKIYIMLGINEVGYNRKSAVSKFSSLVERTKTAQPDAVIFILANLHVSEKRSAKDDVVNNSAINSINLDFSRLADGKNSFYVDSNPIFDDKNGNLASDKTQDGVHLYAKYYSEWGKWICSTTSEYVREG